MKSKCVLAWHFVGDTLRDGRSVPEDGVMLIHQGPLELCSKGLHASRKLIDALQYAPGDTICRVRCSGTIVKSDDKLVCSERTILWRVNGKEILRKFARQQALSVIHLWNAPVIVREYLETGDESKKAAANAANAAWYGAWASARDAARASARDAAWDAAWAAANAANAARAAARAAARDAAWSSANAANAAWAAARAAAWDGAWDGAWSSARDAANKQLTKMVKARLCQQ